MIQSEVNFGNRLLLLYGAPKKRFPMEICPQTGQTAQSLFARLKRCRRHTVRRRLYPLYFRRSNRCRHRLCADRSETAETPPGYSFGSCRPLPRAGSEMAEKGQSSVQKNIKKGRQANTSFARILRYLHEREKPLYGRTGRHRACRMERHSERRHVCNYMYCKAIRKKIKDTVPK